MTSRFFSGILIVSILFSSMIFAVPAYAASCPSGSVDLTGYSDAQLREMLAACNAESAETQAQLTAQKNKSSSLASDVALLDSLIKKAAQQIQIKNQIIGQLGQQITQKAKTIENLSTKLDREHDSLGQILRKKNEIDTMTLAEMLLSNYRISNFFLDIDNFQVINKSLQESVNTIKGVRQETNNQKTDLEKKKLEQAMLKLQIEADKKKTQIQQEDKKVLLASSKNQEKTYESLLAQRQAQAAKISAALFKLAGGSKAIPFGDAYRYAKVASASTGISPAFILAILKQESNLGTDQGGCYVTDLSTGAGTRVRNGERITAVMKAPRDTVPFQTILDSLGYPLATTQVSCPQKVSGSYMGYGGAMGPTQFIPSTWIGLTSRIAAALGKKSANPWDPQDAIMATAIFVKDLGATDPAQERNAACKYYSGRSCSSISSSYGSSVMKYKTAIQSDINILEAAQ